MLKFTYIDHHLLIELLEDSLYSWINDRVYLNLTSGISTSLEPTRNSFFVTRNQELLRQLQEIQTREENTIEIDGQPTDSIEVILKGVWIASNFPQENGIFVASFSRDTELFLFQHWIETNVTKQVIADYI